MNAPTLNVRHIAGAIMILIGLAAGLAFDSFRHLFLFLSPDGQVTDYMWRLARICLLSLGPVGVLLLLFRPLLKAAARIDCCLTTGDQRLVIWCGLASAFILRALIVMIMPFNLWQDFQCYDELGAQWASDGGYYNGEYLTAYWPPGFPFWLSRLYLIFGHEPLAGAIANIFLGTATVLLAYLLIRRLWGERIGRWTLILMALFPSQVFFTNVLASEMLFTPLFLGSMLLFVNSSRSHRWWLAVLLGGMVLGLATLTRTITTLFLLPVALYWIHETRSWKGALMRLGLGVVGLAIVIAPWIVRNHYAVGRACLSTNTGINLYVGNQPSSGMGYNHHAALDFDLWDPTREAEIDSVASARAWEYIREKPLAFLGRGVMKVMFFYAVDVDPLDHQMLQPDGGGHVGGYLALATVVETFYLAVLLMAALAVPVVLRSRIHRGAPTTLLLLTLVYWTGVHFVFFAVGRFHFPVVPILTALAAVFVAYRIDLNLPHATGSEAE